MNMEDIAKGVGLGVAFIGLVLIAIGLVQGVALGLFTGIGLILVVVGLAIFYLVDHLTN